MENLDILLVEDDDFDAKLVQSMVRRAGIEASWTRVDNQEDFLAALDLPHDALITDFRLPSFDALRVLDILAERGIELPTLVVTGALDDEVAADCIKRGAADYLLKDRLARLGDALKGAVARQLARNERKLAEEKLLIEARERIILYSMLSRSLSRQATTVEMGVAEMLAPLLEAGAVPSLVRLSYERKNLPPWEAAASNGGKAAFAMRRELSNAGESFGDLVLSFSEEPEEGSELSHFLDHAVGLFLDFLVRTEAERKLIRSIAEKDELLREIHHRVMNNLAAVAGLVSLEANRSQLEGDKAILAGLGRRINSMALVHEMLYSRGGFSCIDFGDYAGELAIRIVQGMGVTTKQFAPRIDCPGLYVPLETAVTLGILVSELYTHATTASQGGGRVDAQIRAWRPEGKGDGWRIAYTEKIEGETIPPSSSLDLVSLIVAQYRGSLEDVDGRLGVVLNLGPGEWVVPS